MLKRKAYAGPVETLGPRQVRVVASSAEVDRLGEVVVQEGIKLDAFRANPIVLWGHDPEMPIGRVTEIGLDGSDLVATVEFAPEGISKKADEVCGLVKAGILNTVSIGFDPMQTEPMDAADRTREAPLRYLASELLELSFVSIPANRDATVTQRQLRQQQRQAKAPVVRGLYECGRLASLMEDLGWAQYSAAWEAELEQDGSKVPAMLGEVLQQLGAALVAMTQEEVAEMLAALPPADAVLDADPEADQATVTAGKSPAVARFLAGMRSTRQRAAPTPHDVTGRRLRARTARIAALG